MRISNTQLRAELEQARAEASLLHLALNDLSNGEITWFRGNGESLGISRETRASGGLLVHKTGDYIVGAFDWESWFQGIKHNECSLRELAFKVETHVSKAQAAFFHKAA